MSEAASKIYPYLFRYRYRFAVGAVFLVLTTAINLIAPWVLKLAIDHLTTHMGLTGIDVGPNGPVLGFYAGSLVAIAIGGGFCRFFMRRIIIGASREIERDLRNDFFSHLQRLPLVYFQANRTGDLMSRATNDLAAVRMMVGPAIMYSATTTITFTVALGLMLSISPSLTLYALMPLPIVSVVVKWFGSAIYKRSEKIQEQLADLSAIVQEALAGIRVVRAYRREHIEIERFRVANEEYVSRSRALVQLQGAFHPSLALFLGLSGLVVLWMGSQYVIAGQMTIGEFVAFNAYVVMLSWPMIAFGWVTNMLQRGMAAWQRMLNVFAVQPSIRDSAAVQSRSDTVVEDVRGSVEFRNLTFAYNGREVLSNVSATVRPGQMLALVGPTGSGKSTLVELIPRLFDPPPGTVFVDGMDVRDIPLTQLRRAIGYVSQEPFLFSDTMRENISFGALSAVRDETVEAVARLSRLESDIKQFPKGFDTAVGERGITLSGGQKQRTAIARALLTDPRILILDDALSAVDTQTEEDILSGLRGVMRDRTSIVVAHRISTIRAADLILVLDDGYVVERGTHDQLVAIDGLYSSLHRKQLLQQALEAS
jgi:ATP-binding cassette subfamily B multidrug efflux pump